MMIIATTLTPTNTKCIVPKKVVFAPTGYIGNTVLERARQIPTIINNNPL
jgi:hypothetical protein